MIDALLCFSVGRAESWTTWAQSTGRQGTSRTSARFASAKGECPRLWLVWRLLFHVVVVVN